MKKLLIAVFVCFVFILPSCSEILNPDLMEAVDVVKSADSAFLEKDVMLAMSYFKSSSKVIINTCEGGQKEISVIAFAANVTDVFKYTEKYEQERTITSKQILEDGTVIINSIIYEHLVIPAVKYDEKTQTEEIMKLEKIDGSYKIMELTTTESCEE